MIPRPIIAATAAIAILSAAPALAERWRTVPGGANATLAIDLDSIARDGRWRVFHTRTTTLGVQTTIFGIVAMDCKAGITELRGQAAVAAGKVLKKRVFPADKRPRQKIADPARDAAFRIVCGQKLK
ncbi:hypothetical protein [Sphingomonas sp.]|uniref:hypothetical protein n=1 Tax=Sphingomonas sp. TaxID=28214 RepID=UPI001EB54641|nr:hypothetical protein [Sphingomonas sp.]MBX3592930.1 hypothetical protein [Sphingomonas sp.]